MKFIEINENVITINLDLKILNHINFKKVKNTKLNYGNKADYLKEKCLKGSKKEIIDVLKLTAKELCKKGINEYEKYFEKIEVRNGE